MKKIDYNLGNEKDKIPAFDKTGSFIRTANKVIIYIKHKHGIDLTINDIKEIVLCQFKLEEPMKENRNIRLPFIGRFQIKAGKKILLQNMEEIQAFAKQEGIDTGLAVKRFLKEIRTEEKVTFERHKKETPLRIVKW